MTLKRCDNSLTKNFGLRMSPILIVICCSPFWRATALSVEKLTPQLMDISKESCADCFWVKPCRFPPIKTDSTVTNEALKIKDFITFILNYIRSYADNFCSATFNENFAAMVLRDANISYDWIYNGSAPKNIGDRLDLVHYQSIEILLLHAADTLRRAAVGFECIASEEHLFYLAFNSTKTHLQTLLCSIETSSINLDMQLLEHPTREIMSSELRDPQLDGTEKNLRNFRILKALVNLLEYFEDGFFYFSQLFKL